MDRDTVVACLLDFQGDESGVAVMVRTASSGACESGPPWRIDVFLLRDRQVRRDDRHQREDETTPAWAQRGRLLQKTTLTIRHSTRESKSVAAACASDAREYG
jgi:hypothetical protein